MFIPRQPVVDNQFCEFAAQTSDTSGIGGTIAYAGAAVYLAATTNEATEAQVKVFATSAPGSTKPVFGLLMQKVKTGYHQVHPAGYILKQDFGSSDAIAQPSYNSSGNITGTQKVPVGVAHDGGIWDTTHYTSYDGSSTITLDASHSAVNSGDMLYVTANASGRLTNQTGAASGYAMHDKALCPGLETQSVSGAVALAGAAVVIKGVSAAKANSTLNNQTLYPIRIKLLV
jgi:hypothetical protein